MQHETQVVQMSVK